MKRGNTLFLTNIGNRNILWNGKAYSKSQDYGEPGFSSYREWSKHLLDNYESEKSQIEIQILPPLIDKLNQGFSHLVMYYSDQDEEEMRGQDTLYAAQIIERKLVDAGHSFVISLEDIRGSVVDNNSLIKFYRNSILSLQHQFGDPSFYICDAGGTPQCKSSLKIAAEFLLSPEEYQVYYVDQRGSIYHAEPVEYRNVINAEQAITLVRKSFYHAALTSLGVDLKEAEMSRSNLSKLLAYAHFRKHGFHKRAKDVIDRMKNRYTENYPFLSIDHRDKSNEWLITLVGQDLFDLLLEKLFHIQLYKNIGDLTSMILHISIFYETLINILVEKIIGYPLHSNYRRGSKELVKDINERRVKIDRNMAGLKNSEPVNCMSVPVTIGVLSELGDNSISEIISFVISLSPINSNKKVNSLRNRIAHDGLYVDEDILKNRTPKDFNNILDRLFKYFGTKGNSPYPLIEELIISELRS